MDHHDIQINKTSRNTVLFMIHIGTTRGAIAYLIEVLAKISQDLDEKLENQNAMEARIHAERIASLTRELPPLPNFSRFHDRFLPAGEGPGTDGDLREAFFMAYDEESCEYFQLGGVIQAEMGTGRELVSAGFVTPYPPGFPVLVPGQVVSAEILHYLQALDVKEIHGYKPEYGLRVFTVAALEGQGDSRADARRATHDPSQAASGR
jgi:arginine decarboxylase